MRDQLFNEYRRLINAALKAVEDAKSASDRGDLAEFRRLLAESASLGNQAMNIANGRRESSASRRA